MLSRFVQLSKCLLKARHPQPICSTTFFSAHRSYAFAAPKSSAVPARPSSSDWTSLVPTPETSLPDPTLLTLKIPEHTETNDFQFAESLPSTKLSPQSYRRHEIRARLSRKNHGGYPRAVNCKTQIHARPLSAVPRTRPLQRYLKSPLEISLGSWADISRTTDGAQKHSEGENLVDKIDTQWSMRLMRLVKGHRLDTWKTRNVRRFVQEHVRLHMGTKRLYLLWANLPVTRRLVLWQDGMLWCMQNSPKRALLILLSIFKGQAFRPPRYMVQDCIAFLARHFLLDVSKVEPSVMTSIWHLMFNFVDGASADELRSYTISQEAVQLLLKHCNNAQSQSLHAWLTSNRANLSPNTLLQFLEKFVEMGKLDLSIGILERIARICTTDFLHSDQFQSACVKLLRTKWSLEDPYNVQSRILSHMLEIGIRPNTPFYNAILLTMIEARDYATAWQSFGIAQQSSHFKTDAITYRVLLKGAKLSGDSSILETVLRDVNETPDLEEIRLIGDILSAVGELSPGHEFPAMLAFYKQKFDLRPLQELGLCDWDVKAPEGFEVDGKWPTTFVLGQMIFACNKSQISSTNLIQRYNVYHNLVRQEHPLFAPLARDEFVANSFLLAFGRSTDTLQYCTLVIKDMLSPSPSPESTPYATPTVRTWSILLSAYMFNKQKVAAEKVLKMMCDRGLTPDIVTWNTLISGYSAMQDIEGAVGAMRRMEEAGFESNARTMKGLRRLWDRSKLLEKLKGNLEDSPEHQRQPYEELRELVKPDEAEEMFEGSESDVEDDKRQEIWRYLHSYHQRHI